MTSADIQREIRMITFRLGAESYLLDIMSLRQIVPYEGSTAIPKAPDFIEGVIVLRDEVIPIIDLKARLYPAAAAATASLVLITQIDRQTVGLKVDEVRRIVNVSLDRLLPPPEMVAGAGRRELIVAVAEISDEVFLLPDLEALLTRDEKDDLRGSMADAAAVGVIRSEA